MTICGGSLYVGTWIETRGVAPKSTSGSDLRRTRHKLNAHSAHSVISTNAVNSTAGMINMVPPTVLQSK